MQHSRAERLRSRRLMIAAGYEDGNDADNLRRDPLFKLANGRRPDSTALCWQPTLSRLEKTPGPRALVRMARAMMGLYCASFRPVPRRITLDINDTYDGYGFQLIAVFDGEGRAVASMLRPARRPTGAGARNLLLRLVAEIRSHWPRVEVLFRADSHYCTPEMLDFCPVARIDFRLSVAATITLRRHFETLEASTARRHMGAPGGQNLRRCKEFHDGATSWARVERIIARVEVSAQGADRRIVVTNPAV